MDLAAGAEARFEKGDFASHVGRVAGGGGGGEAEEGGDAEEGVENEHCGLGGWWVGKRGSWRCLVVW